jgi:hypothetical protein
MKSRLALLAATAAASLFVSAPGQAQSSSYTQGNYWEISMIDIEDGQDENYLDYLSKQWKRQQEYAKQKGYITGYNVLTNAYPRDGEPDLYLITQSVALPDAKEQEKRNAEFEAFMQRNARQLSEESGKRVTMRHLKGGMLLQELMLK